MSANDSEKVESVPSDSEYFCCLLCGCSLPTYGNRINLFGRSSQINVVNEIKQLNISELQDLQHLVSPPFICRNKCYFSLIRLNNLRQKVKHLTEEYAYSFKQAEGKRPIRFSFKRPGDKDDLVKQPKAVKTSRLSSPDCSSATFSKTQDYKTKAAEDIGRSLHLDNLVTTAPRTFPTTTNGVSKATVRPPDENTSRQKLTERDGIRYSENYGINTQTQPFLVAQSKSTQQAVIQNEIHLSPWDSEQGQMSTFGTPEQSHPTLTQVQSDPGAQGQSHSTVQTQPVTWTHGQSHPTLTQAQFIPSVQGQSHSTVQTQPVVLTHGGEPHPTLTQGQSIPGAQGQSHSTVQTQPVTRTHGQSQPTPTQASAQLGVQGEVVYAVRARTEPQAVLDTIRQLQHLKQTEIPLSGTPSQVSNLSAVSSVMAIPVVLSAVPPNTQGHNFTKTNSNVTLHNNLQQSPGSVFLKVNTGNPVQLSQVAPSKQAASNARTQTMCFAGPFQAHCNPQPKEKEQKEGVWVSL